MRCCSGYSCSFLLVSFKCVSAFVLLCLLEFHARFLCSKSHFVLLAIPLIPGNSLVIALRAVTELEK